MSEDAGAPVDGASAGTLLRLAREAAGLHAATLAANLKVPLRKLEALEADQFEQLGDAVFVRGLASSICRTLKVDPQPVLQRLPQTASPRLVQEGEGINAPFRAPGDGPTPGLLEQVSRPVVLIVLALLLGALVLIFLPMAQRGAESLTQGGTPEPVLPPPGAAANEPAPPAAPEPASAASAVAPAPVAAAAPPAVAAMPAPAAPVPASPPATSAAATKPVPAAAAAPQPPSTPAPGSIVVFRTRAPSWIQVTDATGTAVFQKLMQPGESAGASGTPPLSVVIGSVEATEVQVRGKPYNLAPVSKDNVARFEVK